MFSSLRYPNFRLLWTTSFLSSAARAVQQITIGWLVFDLTGSALLLGTVTFLGLAPTLFLSPFLGVLIDQFDRRKLLIASQGVMALLSLVLAVGVALGVVTTWHVMVFALVSGIDNTIIHVVRQAMLPQAVPREGLLNAVALSSTGFNITRIIAPFTGGVLIVVFGAAGNFVLQALLLVAVALAAFAMHLPALDDPADKAERFSRRLKSGFEYVARDRVLRAVFIFQFALMFLAAPYASLLPAIASDVLGADPTGLGILYAATGAGALIGALALASLGNISSKGLVTIVMSISVGLALAAFGRSDVFLLSVVLLAYLGAAQTLVSSSATTLVQGSTPDAWQGRVMSLYNLNHGTLAIGTFLIGALAEWLGIRAALTWFGLAVAAMAALSFVGLPALRDVRS
jgi:MFS family permease